MSLAARDVTRGGVHIAVSGDAVTMTGTMREPDVVSWFVPLIEEVHRSAVDTAMPEVRLDLRNLEYANAAVWKCFVVWLRMVRQDPRSHYTLRVVSNPAYRWQQVGLPSLLVFGANRLVFEQAEAQPGPKP